RFQWTSTPALVHQTSLAAATLLCNIAICVLLMRIRREHSTKMKSRPEQGLLLSSSISLLMHLLNDSIVVSRHYYYYLKLSYFVPLTIAVATTLPFWTMILLA
ncbi:hypothetical protein PENTCL1PPCAC_14480, partial [Pristionchus entomophagus]